MASIKLNLNKLDEAKISGLRAVLPSWILGKEKNLFYTVNG